MHIAAYTDFLSCVTHLLHNPLPADKKESSGRKTPLYVCQRGHTAAVTLLLRAHGASDSDNSEGYKPIYYAAKANYYEIVRLLLKAGVHQRDARTQGIGVRIQSINALALNTRQGRQR